ncbi:golgin Putative 5 [Wolffia australiana]
MAWLGKVSLGGFPDLAGAVNKLSESVKNIEKNFDSALGLEEKSDSGEASGIWPLAQDTKTLFEPMMAFMGHKVGDGDTDKKSEKIEQAEQSQDVEKDLKVDSSEVSETVQVDQKIKEIASADEKVEVDPQVAEVGTKAKDDIDTDQAAIFPPERDHMPFADAKSEISVSIPHNESNDSALSSSLDQTDVSHSSASQEKDDISSSAQVTEGSLPERDEESRDIETGNVDLSSASESSTIPTTTAGPNDDLGGALGVKQNLTANLERGPVEVKSLTSDTSNEEHPPDSKINLTEPGKTESEVKKLEDEAKMLEAALQGAARQAQSKADEIARLLNENEQLKSTIEELKRKTSESDSDSLREEYHQRVASLERKVYALTRERDTLRREQNKKSDATALLKEKDEIITQIMAEGEELSKKQAAQEATIRKLRAQIREHEEEKQRLNSKLQVEETRIESLKKDKAMTEKLLQETIERSQIEIAAQKEFYTNALNTAKEAEALAEARANDAAKTELESRLRECTEREHEITRSLHQLRQTLVKTQEEADFREDMLKRDIDELQKRYQASELRYNELITQVPDSTRPLLRQIEAMQEAAARKAEAWDGVEKNLNARLEAAEARAAAAEERERSTAERLSQASSRMTILETQIACLRTEQSQLTRSLEKERQRASETRQEYLAASEEAATQEGRAKQLEDELRDLRNRHKQQLQEEQALRELLEKDLERERREKSELEKKFHLEKSPVRIAENGEVPIRKLSSAGSLGSMEESFFLGTSDDGKAERTNPVEMTTISPYYLKTMTPNAFEATLRQKEGELASYISRLASLESIRDSLAEELVKMTEQCEKLRAESALLPGLRVELEALRRRHASALELMGERDEELEELRADIVDLKEMYREQVDMLVNKIHVLSSAGAA